MVLWFLKVDKHACLQDDSGKTKLKKEITQVFLFEPASYLQLKSPLWKIIWALTLKLGFVVPAGETGRSIFFNHLCFISHLHQSFFTAFFIVQTSRSLKSVSLSSISFKVPFICFMFETFITSALQPRKFTTTSTNRAKTKMSFFVPIFLRN